MGGASVVGSEPLAQFHACTRAWFAATFARPTRVQTDAWPPIARGESTLLLAPTGSGKTLAAFLAALDRRMFPRQADAGGGGVRVLYISPLKALGVDIDRNLRGPVAGLRATAERLGESFVEPRIGVRSGDTGSSERRLLARQPPDILITTPESLYLLLTSQAASMLGTVETVIVDEIHVLAPTKRGVHLLLSLERLERLRRQRQPSPRPLQRIGLSATQRPLDEIARLLGGAEAPACPQEEPRFRPVRIIDASEPKPLELRVEVPVEDMARRGESALEAGANASAGPASPSIWPAIHPRLVELIRSHHSTLLFVNSRRLAERLAAAVNELAGEELAMAHHGSVAREQRLAIEDRLKRGTLPALFATSSLELGIDMGAIDLVVQIEAPPSVAAGIQRVGRSGRGIDLASRGVLFPKYRGDLLACAAATGAMRRGAVEALRAPRNPLDLLAQQIVAVVSRETLGVDELFALVRGAAPYAQLPRESFEGVLDMLAGRYPSEQFGELRPRIVWDRIAQTVGPRRGSQRLAVLNGGTIPDRGLYGVHLAGDGPDGSGGSRVGELDEEMVFETQAGDVFLLGASSWRVLEITKDRVLVAPAPGEPGKMPFWRGEGPGRSLEFGRAIGRLTRELLALGAAAAEQVLRTEHGLDARAATNLRAYLQEQQEATGAAPSDRTLVVESCLDEIGDWRVCLMSPFGARVHAPWALAIAARLRREGMDEVDVHWTDDGIVLRLPETLEPPRPEQLLPEADEAEDAVARELGGSSQFAARFRENAARALLLPRRQPQRRTPLWLQRRKAADLLAVAAGFPDFPILLETYRECLRDVFDLPGLAEVLREIEQQTIRVVAVQTSSPSPFAASLLFHYAGNYIYQGDAPLAERRAQALTLDHAQLKLLLGESELRQLLAPEALAEVEDQRQRRNATLRSLDDLHDLLLALGDLTRDEIAARLAAEVDREECDAWITRLQRTARAIEVRIAGETRLAAAEDAARYRDALGVNLPLGLPAALLEPAEKPLWQLVARYARTHGPFAADAVARRFGLGTGPVLDVLRQLEASGRAARGAFSPQGSGDEWCDAEVLREIKRRSLARLRKQVEAVPQRQFARFLPRWQRADRSGRGCDAVLDAVEQLQGAPLGVSDLETAILPARIRDYRPEMLDQLLLAGEIVWQGCESLGPRDGRVALFLADRQPLLDVRQVESAAAVLADDAQAAQLHDALATRGALRFPQIAEIVGGFPPDVLAALWRLVWAGLVTNDTLAPLRSACGDAPAARSAPRRQRSRRPQFRSRRQRVLPGSEGRWTLLPPLDGAQASATERLCAWAGQLVLRYGVVTRELLARETPRGGFAAVYPVLKAMEEAGRLRRGYFVEGLGGLQFAQPGAEQLLRVPPAKSGDAPLLLAAADPANPYGAALPWPAAPASEARPKRAAGARVLLAEGELLAYLSPSGRDLATFVDPDGDAARLLADALADAAGGDAACLLQRIDGRSPADSPWLAALQQAGFQLTSRGLRRLRTPWPAERAADDDADG